MLHHVALEITLADLERSLELWSIIGFERVPEPPKLSGRFVWVEGGGTQIHLALVEEPVVPQLGHAAVVAEDLEVIERRLAGAGFGLLRKSHLWGARRIGVVAPGGHQVEVMAAPPASSAH